MKSGYRIVYPIVVASALTVCIGCGSSLVNLTSSLGGDVAGQRGSLSIVYINNTPDQVVFTFGTYDTLNEESVPSFGQFVLDSPNWSLGGGESSDIVTVKCGRVFGMGSPMLLNLITENAGDREIDDEALVEGVQFFANGATEASGTAPPFEASLGVDFPCEALLIIRFEHDEVGPAPYRIDFELVEPGPAE